MKKGIIGLIIGCVIIAAGIVAYILLQPKPIKVYVFTKDGCPFCERAKEALNDIHKEYPKYFEIEEISVYASDWSVKKSIYEELMYKVGEYFEDEVTGVPYIVIGTSFHVNGYYDELKSQMKNAIIDEFNKSDEDYKDVVQPILEELEKAKKD